MTRTADWLDRQIGEHGNAIDVVGPTVLRLSICRTLQVDLAAFVLIDVELPACTCLDSDGYEFRVRCVASQETTRPPMLIAI